jgi:hypothetical protein
MSIRTDGIYFKDEQGRSLLLRGVNLGGSTKVPYTPDGATHIPNGFFNHRDVSFVGRPFPLKEADEHFARLKSWGLTFLRFLVTWEAIEHAGPGEYDTDYLDYVEAIIDKAAEFGINVFIDPHEDVWSRFTGGDGAPGWTLEAVGFDMTRFQQTGAALVHQTHGDPFPVMHWFLNNTKLAAATMFTLFFAGNDFAPETKIDGEPVQEYLQRHYIAAMQQVAERLKDKPNVVGYDSLNEPARGYVGYQNLSALEWFIKRGDMPTPFQSMALGAGFAQSVETWEMSILGNRMTGLKTIDPQGVTVWREGCEDVWKKHGIWDVDASGQPHLLRPDHFARVNNRPVHFENDYMRPFINRYAEAIREVDPGAIIFIEFDVTGSDIPNWSDGDAQNIVHAPHWYDALTLLTKKYNASMGVDWQYRPTFGRGNVRKAITDTLGRIKSHASDRLGGVPTLIGEIGIPYDLNGKKAYSTGDWSDQKNAIDDYMQALEANLLHFTIWNYTADNNNMRGDNWNGEDLSIFSRDQQNNPSDVNSGGRALEAVIRPYAMATAGEPLRMSFNMVTGVFEYAFRHDKSITAPTEFYIPAVQYADGYVVDVSDGRYEKDETKQRMYYYPSDKDIPHFIVVKPSTPREIPQEDTRQMWIVVLIVLVFAWVMSQMGRKSNKKNR